MPLWDFQARKHTAIDLFIGLIEPNKGKILVDDVDLKKIGFKKWQI